MYFRKLMKFNNTEAYTFKMVLSKIQYYLCQLEKMSLPNASYKLFH